MSIVIPAHLEERRLPGTLAAIAAWLPSAPATCEVLVVVEKGPDATLDIATEFAAVHPGFRVLGNEVQRGKGFAVKTGILAAEGDLILFMDADLSVPLETVDIFYRAAMAEPEVAVWVGNRQHPDSRIVRSQGLLRRSMGQIFNRMVRWLSGIPLHDTQCGFKAFRREAARVVFARQTIDGFAFDVEILWLAVQRGYVVRDLAVDWRNSSDSRVHIVRDSVRMLGDLARLRGRRGMPDVRD